MNTVWKFPLETADEQEIGIPDGSIILSVSLDPAGSLCLWALVNPDTRLRNRRIRIFGTGSPIEDDFRVVVRAQEHGSKIDNFIGTVIVGRFVWHVFEVVR